MECVHCQEDIKFNERRKLAFTKDKKCPYCNKALKLTGLSLFIGVGILCLYVVALLNQTNWSSFYFIVYMVVLWIICFFVLPFVARYGGKVE